MRIIKVVSCPNHRYELLEGSASYGPPGYIWSQVPGIDEQLAGGAGGTESWEWTKRLAAAEVAVGINLLRLAKERIMASREFAAEIGAVMATVAVAFRIDDITALADQRWVLAVHVELDRRNV